MVLTTSLLTQFRTNLKSDVDTLFTHGAIGTDSTTPTAGDTALGTEVFRDARDDFDDSATATVVASLNVGTTEANGNSIAEYGWFNDASSGTMWTRDTITTITKTSDVELYLETSITITVTES